jgi:hypothetical protein
MSKLINNEKTSDSDSETSSIISDNNSEYSEVNLRDDRLYQVLSIFFENEEGDNLTTILSNINENIQVQNNILKHIAQNFQDMKIKIADDDDDNTTMNSDTTHNSDSDEE